MTSIQTFSDVRSLDVTLWPDLEWPESETFTTWAEKMHQERRRFLDIFGKPEGVSKQPPGTARVNMFHIIVYVTNELIL